MKVLQIEQSLFFKKIIKDIILNLGYELILQESTQSAFEIIKKEHLDIGFIIMSSSLSKSSSSEDFLVKISNSEYKNIPIIIITGNDDMEVKRKFLSIGANEVVIKKDLTVEKFTNILESFSTEDKIKSKLKSINIAVIDDSTLVLNVAKNIFLSQGIKNVDCYSHPKNFLDIYSQDIKKYSLFLTDIIMPEISGDEIVRKIREKDKFSPVIVMSSLSSYSAVTPIMSIGANDYISKPFITDAFMITVRNCIKMLIIYENLKQRNIPDLEKILLF